jgi:hypothetical protein
MRIMLKVVFISGNNIMFSLLWDNFEDYRKAIFTDDCVYSAYY